MRALKSPQSYNEWREQALELLHEHTNPHTILWGSNTEQNMLFEDAPPAAKNTNKGTIKVPPQFLPLAKAAACHRRDEKWELLYRILWRLTLGGERNLLQQLTDSDIMLLNSLVKNVRRDVHKMHAFVRFKKVERSCETPREQFIAWYEPEHKIAAYSANFFVKRFYGMDWSIITPEESIHWIEETLHIGTGGSKADVPEKDAHESLWLSYYKSTFNPARLKLKAMQSEMPKKFWKNLPETALIEELTRDAGGRTKTMLESDSLPPKPQPRNQYLDTLKNLEDP